MFRAHRESADRCGAVDGCEATLRRLTVAPTTIRNFLVLAVALLLLLPTACRPKPQPDPEPALEEGWIPTPDGAQWATYEVGEHSAIYAGDIHFPWDELRAYQATIDKPHPVRPESYAMPNGDGELDDEYEGLGDPWFALEPLSGGEGELTDGFVPAYGDWQTHTGWVSWTTIDPTITFHFTEPVEIDTVILHLASDGTTTFPSQVELRAGDTVITRDASLVPSAEPFKQISISGEPGRGLDLVTDTLSVTLVNPGPDGTTRLSEVTFLTGDPELVPMAVLSGSAWDQVVYYEIQDKTNTDIWDDDKIEDLESAMAEWGTVTGHLFQENPTGIPRIRFVARPQDPGCYVDGLGRPDYLRPRGVAVAGKDTDDDGIPDNRCTRSAMLHEIGHALGLPHEQSSPERDDHIRLLAKNITSERSSQWKKRGKPFGEYNYRSIMHYPDYDGGRQICCTTPPNVFQEGLPSDCVYARLNQDKTAYVCSAANSLGQTYMKYTQKVFIPLADLPTRAAGWEFDADPEIGPGQQSGLSKGDISAISARLREQMGSTPNLKVSSHNSLSELMTSGFAPSARDYHVGDFNGDGMADLAAFDKGPWSSNPTGDVWVLEGPDFGEAELWHDFFCVDDEACAVGDVDGDGDDDALTFLSSGQIYIGTAEWQPGGWRFTTDSPVSHAIAGAGDTYHIEDVDGDCLEDAIAVEPYGSGSSTGHRVHVALSLGNTFGTLQSFDFPGRYQVMVGDVDGDKSADVVTVDAQGETFVHRWNGTGFEPEASWGTGFCKPFSVFAELVDPHCQLADMDGDWRADLVGLFPATNHHLKRLKIALSLASRFEYEVPNYHELDCRNPTGCLFGDVDNDGRKDVIDPISSLTENDSANGRVPGYVWVSFGTGHSQGGLWTSYIADYDPTPTGAVCTANQPHHTQVTDFPVDKVVGTQDTSYAVTTSGRAYRHLGGASWSLSSNESTDYGATDTNVFKLMSTGTLARRNADLGWVGVGSGFSRLFSGWGGLFGTQSDGKLRAFNCYCGNVQRSGWHDIGTVGYEIAVGGVASVIPGDDANVQPQLYRRDQNGVWKFTFASQTWFNVGAPAHRIYAGADRLYATYPPDNELYERDPATWSWNWIAEEHAMYAVSQETGSVAALSVAKDSIRLRRAGTNYWTTVAGAANTISFANGSIWATEPGTGYLFEIPVE
jgi:hypothetical protein